MAGNHDREVVKPLQWPEIWLSPAKGEIKQQHFGPDPSDARPAIGVTSRLSGQRARLLRTQQLLAGPLGVFPWGGLTSETFLSKSSAGRNEPSLLLLPSASQRALWSWAVWQLPRAQLRVRAGEQLAEPGCDLGAAVTLSSLEAEKPPGSSPGRCVKLGFG